MRQAGIVAAGALFALKNHRTRLTKDHENARLLASGITSIRGLELNPADVETNMLRFRVNRFTAQELVERLKAAGVLVLPVSRDTIRAVTNLMVSEEDMHEAVKCLSNIMQ
jgi:threonine aldolase